MELGSHSFSYGIPVQVQANHLLGVDEAQQHRRSNRRDHVVCDAAWVCSFEWGWNSKEEETRTPSPTEQLTNSTERQGNHHHHHHPLLIVRAGDDGGAGLTFLPLCCTMSIPLQQPQQPDDHVSKTPSGVCRIRMYTGKKNTGANENTNTTSPSARNTNNCVGHTLRQAGQGKEKPRATTIK